MQVKDIPLSSSCPQPVIQRMGKNFLLWKPLPRNPRRLISDSLLLILSLIRMVISAPTGLGLLLVNINTFLSDFLPSIVTSVFPAAHASVTDSSYVSHTHAKRGELSETKKIIYGCLIPVLVILSGVFAGLTLGYMSLDETQLNVLSISGTP